MKELLGKVREAARLWYEHDADHLSAMISYYSLFAIVPLILLSVTVVSILYGKELVVNTLYDWGSLLGPDLLNLLHQAALNLKTLSVAWHVPFIGILFFSGMVIVLFNNVTSGLHYLWGIPHRGLKGWLLKSKRSLAFTVIFEFYLVATIGFGFFMTILSDFLPFSLGTVISFIFFLLLTTILFALAYRFLPLQAPSFRASLHGAFVASFALTIVKFLVALYISITPVPGLFGAAGVMLVLLLWIYVFSAVFYFGAALAHVYNSK